MSSALAAAAPGAALVAAVKEGREAHWGPEPRYATLVHYGVAVLTTPHHVQKAVLTAEAAHFFAEGKLPLMPDASAADFPVPPDQPARPEHLQVLPPQQMPPAKKGVENHGFNKLRLIHSLAHIESYAIDLSWDVLVRFARPSAETEGVAMPREFLEDWLRIAAEEAKHFSIWNTRLEELDSKYGALPVHEALWSSALETKHSLLARLAVVHAVHEARGLDQAPKMLQQLMTYGDRESVRLLEVIERDELTHVSSGLRWFKYVCEHAASGPFDPIPKFHEVVRANFRGSLLPPFNTEARRQCGFSEEWYLPLAVKKERLPAKAPAEAAGAPAEASAAAAAPAAAAAAPAEAAPAASS